MFGTSSDDSPAKTWTSSESKRRLSLNRILHDLQKREFDDSNATSPTSLASRLNEIALDKGFKLSDNEGSGNCMFYALSEQLDLVKGIQTSHDELRQDIVQYLEDNPTLLDGTELFNFVDRYRSWDVYLRNMSREGTLGDHVVLYAAANCFHTCIDVVSLTHHQDLRITPEHDVDSSKQLVLGHVHELHYVSLRPIVPDGISENVEQTRAEKERMKEELDTLPRAGSKPREKMFDDNPPQLSVKIPKTGDLPNPHIRWSNVALPVDILLLTLKESEFLSCFYYLDRTFKSYSKEIGPVYFGSSGSGDQKKLKIALIKCLKGSAVPGGSSTAVKMAVSVLRPKAVFSVGTCTGISPEKTKLGDVVVSSKFTTPTGLKTPVSRNIGNLIRHIGDRWIAPLDNPDEREVRVHRYSDILSHPRAARHEDTAFEREGEDLFTAHDDEVEWLIVNGVASFGEKFSSGVWVSFASAMAASVVANILNDPTISQGWHHYTQANKLPDDDEGDGNLSGNAIEEATEVEERIVESLGEFSSDEEDPEDPVEEGPEKTTVHQGIVTSKGAHWDFKIGSVHLIFPPDAVSEPTSIAIHKWKWSACSPHLEECEAIVSNVVEISTTSDQALEFNAGVKLFLSHSASNLLGYELVIKRLIDKETNEWEEVNETKNCENLSDVESDYPSQEDIPTFFFPVAQTVITKGSTYAVVCRLKSSPTYTITCNGGSFSHPDFPGVTITIPENAVETEARYPLQLKVQEVPSDIFEGEEVFFGPILRISCSKDVKFLKPVTIQLPVSLRGDREGIRDRSKCHIRVLFLNSDGECKEWTEITNELVNSTTFDGMFLRFQVQRFSKYMFYCDASKDDHMLNSRCLEKVTTVQPMAAWFFAHFEPSDCPLREDTLYYSCYPNHERAEFLSKVEGSRAIRCEVTSLTDIIPGCVAFLSLTRGIEAVNLKDMATAFLTFRRDQPSTGALMVRVIQREGLLGVAFHCFLQQTKKQLLAKISFRQPDWLTFPSIAAQQTSTSSDGLAEETQTSNSKRGSTYPTHKNCKWKQCLEDAGTSSDDLVEESQAPTKFKRGPSHKRKRNGEVAGTSSDDLPEETQTSNSKRGSTYPTHKNCKWKQCLEDAVKKGCPTEGELIGLSRKTSEKWKKLGRQLDFEECDLIAIEQDNAGQLVEKAYAMLRQWTQWKGRYATYKALYKALCDGSVQRRDLAQEFCCASSSPVAC